MSKTVTLDVRQNTINRAKKLIETHIYHGDVCPLALAGKKVFRKKNQKCYVGYGASLTVDYLDNNGTKVKREVYHATNYKKTKNFIIAFDLKQKVKPGKFKFILVQTY